MQFRFQNFLAKTCDLNDYEAIIDIFESQRTISGANKTPAIEYFAKENIKSILEGIETTKIIGVENLKTKKLLVYCIIQMPKDSPFMFIRLGEAMKNNSMLGVNSHAFPLFKLASMWAESKNRFDFFWSVRIQNFYPMMRLIKKYGFVIGEPVRYMFNIHSILLPEDSPKTAIEQFMCNTDSVFTRNNPIVIGHASLKPQFRLEYFKDKLHYSVEEAQKFIYED